MTVTVLILVLLGLLIVAGLAIATVLLVVWLVRRKQTPPPSPVRQISPRQTSPPSSANCPRCGAMLPADSPQGLCPRCVLGVGLATQTEATGECGPHGTKIVPPTEADVARRFPHLEILGCLGHGGMGVVYKARQPKLNRSVALKILAPEKGADPKFAERFLREAQALARLSHPNIVTVHDFGEADGMFFLLMEYVDGMTLRQLLREGLMKPEAALAIVPPICEALQFAHEQGVVHRDIKPENVLLDKQGRVKIADFGIAKIINPLSRPADTLSPSDGERARQRGAGLTQDHILGTPHYMAPEQVEKPATVDHRADIYSLGVVFYEMLTGELPLGKFQPPSKKVQVDVRLDEVVLHALEKEPERRYQQASQVKSDVETIAGSAASPSGGSGREEAQTGKSAMAVRSPRKAIGFGFASLCFLVATLLWAIRARDNWDQGVNAIHTVLNLAAAIGFAVAAFKQGRPARLGGGVGPTRRGFELEKVWVPLAFLAVGWALCSGVFDLAELWRSGSPGRAAKAAAWLASAVIVGVASFKAMGQDRRGGKLLKGMCWLFAATGVGFWLAAPHVPDDLIRGVVSDAVTGKPIPGATITVHRPDQTTEQAVRHTKTDASGAYRLVIPEGAGFLYTDADGVRVSVELTIEASALGYASDSAAAMQSQAAGYYERLLNFRLNPQGREVKPDTVFGAETEVTLTEFNNMDGQEALDLDTGTVLAQPKDLEQWSEAELAQWIKDQGVDLFVDHGPGGQWGLLTTTAAELKLASVTSDKPARITERELEETLSSGQLPAHVPPRGILKVYPLPKESPTATTLAFKTSSGSSGLLWIAGFTDTPRGVQIRYKLVRQNDPVSITHTAEVGSAAISPSIGEVVELTVTDLADLDKGTLLNLPLPGVLPDRDPARYDWFNSDTNAFPFMRREGIDLFQGNHGLIGVDLLVVPLESKDWRGLRSTELRAKLDALQLPKAPATSIIPEARRPFGFQTREGALGIFEITDANLPRGVKLRYKLVRNNLAEPGLAPKTDFVARLPDRSFVELVCLMYGSNPRRASAQTNEVEWFWNPDGTPSVENIGWSFGPSTLSSTRDPALDYRKFVARWGGPDANNAHLMGWQLDEHPPDGADGQFTITPKGESAENWIGLVQGFPRDKQTAAIRFALASGPYVTGPKPNFLWSSSDKTPYGSFSIGKIFDHNGNAAVTLTHNLKGCDYRLRITSPKPKSTLGGFIWEWKQEFRRDERYQPVYGRVVKGGAFSQTFEFPGVPAKEAMTTLPCIDFEVRPVQWVEFQNVALNPGKETRVQIRVNDAAAPATDVVKFGPVMERVLPDPDNGAGKSNRETLNLKTGEQTSILDNAPKEGGGRLRALVASEGDLFAECDDFVSGRWAFVTAGLKLSDFLSRQWETATPEDVGEVLKQPSALQRMEHSGATLYYLPDGLLPLTFAFESRTGERGLLQITGFTDNPRGVKVRYKLVQSPAH